MVPEETPVKESWAATIDLLELMGGWAPKMWQRVGNSREVWVVRGDVKLIKYKMKPHCKIMQRKCSIRY